jgi:hypothetical protein
MKLIYYKVTDLFNKVVDRTMRTQKWINIIKDKKLLK